MPKFLKHNGFSGYATREEDGSYYGKITGISDLITFTAESEASVQMEFESAVADYIELLSEL